MLKGELYEKIIKKSLDGLSFDFGYFGYLFSVIKPQASEETQTVATTGKEIFANPDFIINLTANGGVSAVQTSLVHVLIHGMLLHPYFVKGKNYGLYADIVVFSITDEMNMTFDKLNTHLRKSVYKSIMDKFGDLSDKSVKTFCDELDDREVERLKKLFTVCDHGLWEQGEEGREQSQASLEEIEFWINLQRTVLPKIGNESLRLKERIRKTVVGSGNYVDFLRSFLSRREKIKQNPDEFDYIYYCFGLSTYKNMPLIENLEYKDENGNASFVIAIDTSGSTKGKPVKKFLSEIYKLAVELNKKSKKFDLIIVECDTEIKSVRKVADMDEFGKIIDDYTITGGGGTDFRPIFDFVKSENDRGEKIKGIIYFTDGYGIFPSESSQVKSCFVIYNDFDGKITVPCYAERIDVFEEEIQ